MKDIRIDNSANWKHQHRQSILSAYGNSPFYDHYESVIDNYFGNDFTFLIDACKESLTVCLEMLDLVHKWQHTESYQKEPESGIKDLRATFSAKNRLNTPNFFQPKSYLQVFGKQFVPNLSILDLIFCEGPNSKVILSESVSKNLLD